ENCPHAGGGKTAVHAPLSVVRKVITDYPNYKDFIHKFSQSRRLKKDKDTGATDTYLEVPILHGAYKVWAVTRFMPPHKVGSEERVDGKMLDEKQSNVKDLRAVWRLIPCGEDWTILKLELLMVPNLRIGVPNRLITSELMSAADQAVSG